ncbi:GntR family transcriptional regulator [Streptomyces sp. NPDC047000]|uniref:GntR family transcriptional regulator n=1 Tax=Streptomyces sp. NPDC047000 TaxID=3155474 RepID=UPI0033DC7400
MNTTNIRQFEKVSLRERVSRALRAAIVSGELEPGVVYSAPALGARFGVSATPVREAMLDLVRENLVMTVRNKGFRVATVEESDLDEITELRMLIEPPLAAQVTPLIPAGDMPMLREMADAIVQGAMAGDLVAYTESDRAFHLRLLEYAGNRRVTALISDLRAHTRLFGLASLYESGELEASAREHHTILDAIASGDAQQVQELMAAHISQTRGRWARPAESPAHD